MRIVETDPDGELPLPDRRRLRAPLGPWEPVDAQLPPAGLRRRVALELMCARRALPLGIAAAERMLVLAEDVLERRVDREVARREAGRFANWARDQDDLPERAAIVAEACRSVVFTALAGDYGDDTPLDATDADLDGYEYETAWMVALLADDVDQRRAFWRWYVTEAVPAAWWSG